MDSSSIDISLSGSLRVLKDPVSSDQILIEEKRQKCVALIRDGSRQSRGGNSCTWIQKHKHARPHTHANPHK